MEEKKIADRKRKDGKKTKENGRWSIVGAVCSRGSLFLPLVLSFSYFRTLSLVQWTKMAAPSHPLVGSARETRREGPNYVTQLSLSRDRAVALARLLGQCVI